MLLCVKNKGWNLRKNGKRRNSQRLSRFMEALFLWLRLGIASRKLSTVCSLALGQGRISSPKSDAQARLPSHTATRGKRLRTRRLLCTRPSRQQRWFHVCLASLVVLRVPRLCDRCVLQQPVVCFENQGLSAKMFHHP
jgi:hypothetical protein